MSRLVPRFFFCGVFVLFVLLFPSTAAGRPSFAPPDNDYLANAQLLTGNSGRVSESNVDATREDWEEPHARQPGGASIWFQWMAPQSGLVVFTTDGSNLDTLLGIYRRESGGFMREVASDDDSGIDRASRATFDAIAGTQYYVAVDGYRGVTGNVVLSWSFASRPANDNLPGAQTIAGNSGSVRGSNANATKEEGEGTHAGNAGGASIWYRWRAVQSGATIFDTVGSDFDTILAVATRAAGGTPQEIASDDDSGGNRTSRLTFNAQAGTEYYIVVDGYSGKTGSTVLTWKSDVAPAPQPAPEPAPPDSAGTANNTRPQGLDQFDASGAPYIPQCRGTLRPGQDMALVDQEMPARLALCFENFGAGFVQVQIARPDRTVRPARPAQVAISNGFGGPWEFVIPLQDPPGIYAVTATQGNLTAKGTFRLSAPTRPQVVMMPSQSTPGATFTVYLAGFPANKDVTLSIYRPAECPSSPEYRYAYKCWQYTTTFRTRTDAAGRKAVSIATRADYQTGEYELVAYYPGGTETRALFGLRR